MDTIFILLILFQFKHFVSDYPLQTQYMLKKAGDSEWLLPLSLHAFVHSLGTLAIALIFNYKIAIFRMVADLSLHFILKIINASPKLVAIFTPTQPYFCWAVGMYQMAHHRINYIFIYIIISW